MRRLPIRQADKMFFERIHRQTGNDTRRGSVSTRRLDGTYNVTVNGTTMGNLSSVKGEYDVGTNVMVHSYNQRTNDFIAGPASPEDAATQAAYGFDWDASNEDSLL